MDSSQNRPSGLPRLSRLPVPKTASSIPRPTGANSPSIPRPSPSIDSRTSFIKEGELHSPKLRAPASRGQLRGTTTTTPAKTTAATPSRASLSRSTGIRPPAIGTPSRTVSTPQRRTSAFTSRSVSRSSQFAFSEIAEASPTRQDQFISADDISPVDFSADTEQSPLDDPEVDGTSWATPKTKSTKPRPSLTERTIETLSRVPPSPAIKKKSSAIFEQGRPSSRAGSGNSRPSSSYNSDGSGRPQSRTSSQPPSRPGSRAEQDDRQLSNNYKSALSTIDGTPEKGPRDVSDGIPLTSACNQPEILHSRSPSPIKSFGRTPTRGSATVFARPLKTKTSANNLFKKPSLPALRNGGNARAKQRDPASKKADDPELTYRKSSAALREQIAKAKAAKRAVSQSNGDQPSPSEEGSFRSTPQDDFGFDIDHSDPFGQRKNEPAGQQILKQRIGVARTTGKLNIAALGLTEMPEQVMNMYNLESMDSYDGSWAESVDLTRLIAPDNRFAALDDAIFPDVSLADMTQDEDAQPNIFAGLETIDLHGNQLANIPVGFRQLSNVTSLNLSSNTLSNSVLETIAQMASLRDLKLAKNKLSGELGDAISKLDGLEILDLHGNQLTSIPDAVSGMSRLRILNLSENSITSLPFAALTQLPLTELLLRKNKLSGTMIENPTVTFSTLQTLDISVNQIKYLVATGSELDLPVLHTLSISTNRVQELPDMSTWTSLLTLQADENGISVIPESFASLPKLRQADFSGNDIRALPAEIARMDSLSMLRLSGNPLRDKKFVTATTDEIKDTLAGRLEPPPPYQEQGDPTNITSLMGQIVDVRDKHIIRSPVPPVEDASDGDDKFATPPTSAPHSVAHSRDNSLNELPAHLQPIQDDGWTVKAGGVLDRSRTESSSLSISKCTDIASKQQVRQLQLHHNTFTALPVPVRAFASTLTSLSFAYNQLSGDYLTEILELPVLTEINIVSNKLTTLAPLTDYLQAPALEKMDVSFNRIATLPNDLLTCFPKLTIFLAANNSFTELDPESIKGLKIVDVSNNDIGQLNPRIGLLGGVSGLERLEVSGNRFKVPRWNILEQGTHATLRWLRGRVPRDEMTQWKEANGEDGSDDVD